jgi:hypothetical protein
MYVCYEQSINNMLKECGKTMVISSPSKSSANEEGENPMA